ncbi:hypothetical protein SLS60_003097 [Paraconiothyrium brasiliense]|uniref:Uncharacterized protein n=1 Tax=Paraconiothyrium brasiliense TaxID=300254 RepID=A0ABR3RV67_9PLEO
MVPLFFKPAKSVHDQSAQTDELVQSDQPAQSEQDVEQDQSAELDDPTQPPVTTVRTFELRRLRREANGNTARANATRMLRQRIEEMMQEDLLGEWFTHEMPLRPANAEAVGRLRQAVDQQQRNLAARRRVDLEEEDEL